MSCRNIKLFVNQFRKETAFHVFRDPVPADAPGYFEVITHPMDLGTIAGEEHAGVLLVSYSQIHASFN